MADPFGVQLTKRYTNPAAESLLFTQRGVPSGSVELVDYIGGDPIVERVATAGLGRAIFKERPSMDDFLLYLSNRSILEPFRSTQFKFCIESPIEVALHLVYAQAASVNEVSARYSLLPSEAETLHSETITSLLGGDRESAERVIRLYDEARTTSKSVYDVLVGKDVDLARELSRSVLGMNNYTRFYWKIDLASLAQLVQRYDRMLGQDDTAHASVVLPFVRELGNIAHNISPMAWSALLFETPPRSQQLTLTLPRDDVVVDTPLASPEWSPSATRRVCVPALEQLLYEPRELLDHGLIQAAEYMGDDAAIAAAARASYGRGTKTLSDDIALIRSLIRDQHSSPVEMAELAVESRMPAFVDPRQAGRHRTLDFHGFMGYAPLGDLFYLPSDEQLCHQDLKNRQGRAELLSDDTRPVAREILHRTLTTQRLTAQEMQEYGAPQSVVRKIKGVGFYTKTWRTGDAKNWGHFVYLREDAHAQHEIQVYANFVRETLCAQLPHTMRAMSDYQFSALRLSAAEQAFLREHVFSTQVLTLLVKGKAEFSTWVDPKDHSKGRKLNREGEEFVKKLQSIIPSADAE